MREYKSYILTNLEEKIKFLNSVNYDYQVIKKADGTVCAEADVTWCCVPKTKSLFQEVLQATRCQSRNIMVPLCVAFREVPMWCSW